MILLQIKIVRSIRSAAPPKVIVGEACGAVPPQPSRAELQADGAGASTCNTIGIAFWKKARGITRFLPG